MNTTVNRSSCYFLSNPTAQRIGETFAYSLIFVVSLYKTQRLRKPINYFIVSMAMSDLLYPIFLFPRNTWAISGLSVVLLVRPCISWSPSYPDVSMLVSIQSLVLIAVERFGAVVFPLRSPLISSKLCPFFIVATWIVPIAVFSPYLFAFKLVEDANGKQYCKMPLE